MRIPLLNHRRTQWDIRYAYVQLQELSGQPLSIYNNTELERQCIALWLSRKKDFRTLHSVMQDDDFLSSIQFDSPWGLRLLSGKGLRHSSYAFAYRLALLGIGDSILEDLQREYWSIQYVAGRAQRTATFISPARRPWPESEVPFKLLDKYR